MRILLDTNILIPLEPTSTIGVEPQTQAAIRLVALAGKGKHELLVHPAVSHDLARDKELGRARLRRSLFEKYSKLESAPSQAGDANYGIPEQYSNDWVDNQLLFAVEKKAADILVTEDRDLHKKAERLGLGEQVYFLAELIESLAALIEKWPEPPPKIEIIVGYDINAKDPIFETLRKDYGGVVFDKWFDDKVCKRQRRAFVIPGNNEYAGICILKEKEDNTEYGLGPDTVKICTFKVSDAYQGNLYGELFLKAVFSYAKENSVRALFVTIFEKHQQLISLFEKFGFEKTPYRTGNGDDVYSKQMLYVDDPTVTLPNLKYHIRFGPWVTKFSGNKTYVVPIQDAYHKSLFPDYPDLQLQLSLGATDRSFGNALSKVYVCNAQIRKLVEGDNILFYRSDGAKCLTVLGIIESTLVTKDVDELSKYVLKRTVFSPIELEALCRGHEALAIRFRQVRHLEKPIEFKDLLENNVLNGVPQSIQEVSNQGVKWLSTLMK